MVPMLTCGLVRSNLALATVVSSSGRLLTVLLLAVCLGDDFLGDVAGDFRVGVELHAVARPALGPRPQVADVAEHLRQRHERLDDAGPAALLHRLDLTAAGVEVA